MAWLKLHTDVLGDSKLMRAARKGAKNLALLPWLLAFAKEANDGGRLTVDGVPADPEDIAALIPGVRPKDVTTCCDSLISIRILTRDDDGAYRFTNWQKRQQKPPSDAPERVRERVQKHRAHHTSNGHTTPIETTEKRDVTSDVTTPQRRYLAREVEVEVEAEVEEKRKTKSNRGGAQRPAPPGWVGEALAVWTRCVGHTTPAKVQGALSPLVAVHEWPAVKAALEVYVSPDEGPAVKGRDRRVDWFAADFHRWRAIAETPIDDGRGALTERGRRLMSAGASP